jgi:hypothetical protein
MEFQLIPDQAGELFAELVSDLPKSYANALDELTDLITSQCGRWVRTVDYEAPARRVERLLERRFQGRPDEKSVLTRALLANLALKTHVLLEKENLPDSVLVLYPAAFDRMAADLRIEAEGSFDPTSNSLSKYIRFLLALTVPCGAVAVDLASRIPFSSVVLSVLRGRDINILIRYLQCKGFGTWFRSHVDVGYLEEFNEAGWERYYIRIAELLSRREHVRGLVGTSWLYDPQLLRISPRHSYLQVRTLERGAFLMRHRGAQSDVEQATKTSKTRRRLHREGEYTPVSYSLVWGRKELLSWARSVSSESFGAEEGQS